MTITFTINVEIERLEGKFASKDELTEQVQEWLEAANDVQLEGENGGLYEVTNWDVVQS